MNKSWFYLGAICILAIVLTSCDSSKKTAPPATSPSVTNPVVSPQPVAFVPATPAAAPATVTAIGIPTVAGKKSVPVGASAGSLALAKPLVREASRREEKPLLDARIASTNGDNWAKTVLKGRSDPFAALTLQPIEVVEKDPFAPSGKPIAAGSINSASVKSGLNKSLPTFIGTSNPITGNGKITKSSTGTDTGITRDRNAISSISKAGINRVLPKIATAIKPTRSAKSPAVANSNILRPKLGSTNIAKAGNTNVLRPLSDNDPQLKTSRTTDIAAKSAQVVAKPLQSMAIEVSGIIEVEGKTQVIVKLPNESFSRYVALGERVVNGTILVKRVEAQETFSPTIILEEVGIEVSRKIGEKLVVSPESNFIPPTK